jgi:hypothetical protein
MAKHKVKRYDGEEGSVVTEKRVDINNPGAYKMPERRKSDEEIEDSFSKETEPGSATPSIPEKSVSSEKTINYDSDKPKVVTKEELAKSGLTLREYMNKQQGLKPRGESAPSAPAKTSTPKLESAPKSKPVVEVVKSTSSRVPTSEEAAANRQAIVDKVKSIGKSFSNYVSNFETPAERRSRERKESSTTKMAKGGMTASSRADGIAQRGKTRGKMC